MLGVDMGSLTQGERFRNGLVFAALSLVLVVPGGPMLLALTLSAMGVWAFKDWRKDLAQAWQWPEVRIMAMGLTVFVGVGIFLGVWYGYRPGYYEAFIPFLLTPLMLQGVLKARLQAAVLWLGAAPKS